MDTRIKKMAEVLVKYSLAIKKGDRFFIRSTPLAQPLVREVYRMAIKRGAVVDVVLNFPELQRIYLETADEELLKEPTPLQLFGVEHYNKFLGIGAAFNSREMAGIPGEVMKRYSKGTRKVTERMFEREAKGEMKWCGTAFPTHAAAQEASMSLEAYEDFVFDACGLNEEDPTAYWKEVSQKQKASIAHLNKLKEIHVTSKDTDLRLSVAGRKWINCDGKVNFPDGEIFTSPVEDSVNGKIRFSFPGIYMGQEVEDIQLQFKDGKVVAAKAKKGEDLLQQLLKTDEGASRLGEFAIGTNFNIPKFSKSILFDEKLGGTIHCAIGAGFPEAGSKNKSGVHWDMICDMKEGGKITGDGKIIYRNGKLVF